MDREGIPRYFDSLEAARQHAGILRMGEDADCNDYLVCPVAQVRCDEPALKRLQADLHPFFRSSDKWLIYDDNRYHPESSLWLSEELKELRLQAAVQEVLAGRAISLFNRRLDVHAHDEYGITGLHVAAARGILEMAEAFIAAGADVNARDSSGKAPIHDATEHGHESIVRILIAAGADVNAQDNRTWTPLVYTRKYVPDPEPIVAILKAAGAHTTTRGRLDWSEIRRVIAPVNVRKTLCSIGMQSGQESNLPKTHRQRKEIG